MNVSANCSPVTGWKREGRALLQLHRPAAAEIGGRVGRREGFESTGDVALQLVTGDYLRSLQEARCIGIAQPDHVEQSLSLVCAVERSREPDLVIIEPLWPEAEASAEERRQD